MHKKALLFTGISGALIVGLGAIGAHTLREQFHLADKYMMTYETAVRYQAYHTLALLGLSIWLFQAPSKLGNSIALLFKTGIILFSGSLYFLALRPLMGVGDDQMKWVGIITPLGGLAFISGWILLIIYALKLKS
jgi:uncharacterized membrane protein YgdD (TMEM256/DUF423 family)